MSVDTVLKIDGREFEFLRTLPITLGRFLLAKLIVMNLVPVTTGVGLVLAVAYLDPPK